MARRATRPSRPRADTRALAALGDRQVLTVALFADLVDAYLVDLLLRPEALARLGAMRRRLDRLRGARPRPGRSARPRGRADG